ncbi:acrosomal protein SP-10 isoform X1 [Phodopus roborovskii]|uniref:Acrv1 protein n=1 Tax=Phodopus roborovskii TaxID=109678 RepID=A0AAU9ZTQ4_PHORO|nr:acrosomal protein SP-10 isoform X1 [Phodopus roborovskii]CAH6860425.1 Acrv1 [Phodopus roborovskii]
MKELIFLCLYLLGSARGAPPGQPDELDSVDRQASVQQLSSEYFSLANPSDVEALYETPSGEKALTDHSSSEHESSEHTSGEHTSEEQSSELISGEHMSGQHITGGHITGEHITGEHTSGEHTSGEHTSGEPAEQSSEAASETSSAEQVSGEKPEEVEQVASEASGEKNEAMSTPFPSSSSGAAINCHTCAYMNDDGKCLRGEGVCTTQNSQQCMLKKIFEGGKLQFMVQGCENMCPSMNLFSHGTRMQIMCCRNEPLCNKT